MVRKDRRRRSRRPATALATWSGRVALAVGIICLGLGAITPPAGADNARISAEARCDRIVSWVVQAVADTTGGRADSPAEADRVRTNPSIEVSYRPEQGQGSGERAWRPVKTSPLNSANNFTFSGSFPLPDGVDAVELQVSAHAKWRDGSEPGSPKYAVARVPEQCASSPAVAEITPDCQSGGAVVAVENVGNETMKLDLSVDRVQARTVELTPGGKDSVTVPILTGTSSVVRVNAGDFLVAQRKVEADCGTSGPAAVVLERCQSHQAVVSASSREPKGSEAPDRTSTGEVDTIEIRADGTIVHKGDLASGKVFQRTFELPENEPTDIEVSINGKTAAIGQVGACDSPILGAVSCGGDGQPACAVAPDSSALQPPPPPPPPPLTIELDANGLPVTGPWQRAIALLVGGALLSVGGLAVVVDQRRRPKPSLLAASVGDYRRQWWS